MGGLLGSEEISELSLLLVYSYYQGIMTSPDPPPSLVSVCYQVEIYSLNTFQAHFPSPGEESENTMADIRVSCVLGTC